MSRKSWINDNIKFQNTIFESLDHALPHYLDFIDQDDDDCTPLTFLGVVVRELHRQNVDLQKQYKHPHQILRHYVSAKGGIIKFKKMLRPYDVKYQRKGDKKS